MLPTGIVIYLILGVTLIPVLSSSIESNVALTVSPIDMKSDITKTGSSRSTSDQQDTAWTKFDVYHATKQEELKKKKQPRLYKTRRKDSADNYKTSYSILDDDANPYFRIVNASNLKNVSLDRKDVDGMRVWQNYTYPESGLRISRYEELDRSDDKIYNYKKQGDTSLVYEMMKRSRREVSESTIKAQCAPFTDGEPDQNMFHSPGYPNNYPNGSDCIKVISARPGQIITLDFRNYFHVEEEKNCPYDALEVRDGAHGYSNLIGSYCGQTFPPLLTSTGRYLWLRFRSDDNIEYKGFTAIYEFQVKPTTPFLPPELDICRFERSGNDGFINKSDIDPERIKHSLEYGVPLDCMWVITVDLDKKIYLSFETFDMKKPNDCDSNFIDIFPNRTDLPNRIRSFCGSIADSVDSKENVLNIRFLALAGPALNSSFSALFTAYKEKKKDSNCADGDYDCEDNMCLDSSLKCNGHFNCRLKWDEDGCNDIKGSSLVQSDHIIIILVVFTLILVGMSVVFVFNCIKKLISDHRIIQEHIRQSREGNLDCVGDMTTKIAEPVSKISIKQDGLSPRSGSGQLDNVDCYVPGVGEILPILLQNDIRERPCRDASIHNNRDNEMLMRQQSIQRNEREKSVHEDKDSDSDDQGNVDPAGSGIVPEMCDSCCQTRESLFQTTPFHHQSSSDRSFSPILPNVDYSRKPMHSSDSSTRPYIQQASVTPFSTFGYSGSTIQRMDSRQSSKAKDPKYKAEAVIEMDHYMEDNGNYDPNKNGSVQTTDLYGIEDQMNQNRIHNQSKDYGDKHYKEQARRQFERRPYSVETTKSAPDVIIMTKSH